MWLNELATLTEQENNVFKCQQIIKNPKNNILEIFMLMEKVDFYYILCLFNFFLSQRIVLRHNTINTDTKLKKDRDHKF